MVVFANFFFYDSFLQFWLFRCCCCFCSSCCCFCFCSRCTTSVRTSFLSALCKICCVVGPRQRWLSLNTRCCHRCGIYAFLLLLSTFLPMFNVHLKLYFRLLYTVNMRSSSSARLLCHAVLKRRVVVVVVVVAVHSVFDKIVYLFALLLFIYANFSAVATATVCGLFWFPHRKVFNLFVFFGFALSPSKHGPLAFFVSCLHMRLSRLNACQTTSTRLVAHSVRLGRSIECIASYLVAQSSMALSEVLTTVRMMCFILFCLELVNSLKPNQF